VYGMGSYFWKYIIYYHFINIVIDVLLCDAHLIQYKKRYPAVIRFQRFGYSVHLHRHAMFLSSLATWSKLFSQCTVVVFYKFT
jgi:hypothetical protein